MTVTDPRDVAAAATWAIRPEEPIDLDLVDDLHRAAFHGPAEAELVDAIRSSAHHVAEGSLVAVTADGSVLGHVLLSQVVLERPEEPPLPILALAPLGVLPPHQGRGIGTALLRAAMAVADRRPEPLVVVLGAPSFYAPFGFVPASEAGITGPYDAAGEAFQVRVSEGHEPPPGGTVVYPPAFGALEG